MKSFFKNCLYAIVLPYYLIVMSFLCMIDSFNLFPKRWLDKPVDKLTDLIYYLMPKEYKDSSIGYTASNKLSWFYELLSFLSIMVPALYLLIYIIRLVR